MSDTPRFLPRNQAQAPFFVGIDLGAADIQVGVLDDRGRPLSRLTIPTDSDRGPEDAACRMGKAAVEAIARAGLKPSDVARVGLGAPGAVDLAAGTLLKPAAFKDWDNFPLRDRVGAHCGLPVTLASAVNAAAYGEFWVGAGRDFQSMVLLMLGTRVDCGIIVGDLFISGQDGCGPECGHIIIDFSENARPCSCGQHGHIEAYVSAAAMAKRANEALRTGRPSSLFKRLGPSHELTPKDLAEEAEAGDALSLEIIAETAHYLAVGIVNLMHTIDPNGVLLSGPMTFGGNETALGRRFLGWIKEEIARRAFPVLVKNTIIDFASLGSDAGYIGAAGLARLECQKLIR